MRGHIRLSKRSRLEVADRRIPGRPVIAAFVLASLSLIALDQTPALHPIRGAVGDVFGPAEDGIGAIARPVTSIPGYLRSKSQLQHEVDALTVKNSQLEQQVRTSGFDRNRLSTYIGLTSVAANLGYDLVPAHVVAYGPAQSFSRTVTIDAGRTSGIRAGETVVASAGLVGRVLSTTATTATVLLAIDADSYIGGRLGDSMKAGYVRGTGSLVGGGSLTFELLDQGVTPRPGEVVVSWGNDQNGPYLSGLPLGVVKRVYANVQNSLRSAVIDPYVDFSALDLVGVAVPVGTRSDRGLVHADGTVGNR